MPEFVKRRIQKIQKGKSDPKSDSMAVATTLAKDMPGWQPGNNCELKVRSDGAVVIRPVQVETNVQPIDAEADNE